MDELAQAGDTMALPNVALHCHAQSLRLCVPERPPLTCGGQELKIISLNVTGVLMDEHRGLRFSRMASVAQHAKVHRQPLRVQTAVMGTGLDAPRQCRAAACAHRGVPLPRSPLGISHERLCCQCLVHGVPLLPGAVGDNNREVCNSNTGRVLGSHR